MMKALLLVFFIFYCSLLSAQQNDSSTSNKEFQQQERLKKEKAKAEQLKKRQTQNSPNATNARADANDLISRPYFTYRNQVLDGMNVVGKGIIRKFDKQQTNEENIKALNEWVKENKDLFNLEFLKNADEYYKQALKE